MNCTYWEGSPEEQCGREAVARQGIRCPNGCWGEGEFDYACQKHKRFMDRGPEFECMKCEALLETFPVQELVL